MAKYRFETTTTVKEYAQKKWWIDSGIVRPVTVQAASVADALKQYKQIVGDRHYVSISNNALSSKSPMYVDYADGSVAQVGYVITGATDFDNGYGKTVKQYVDLWVTITEVVNPFESVA